MKKQYLFIGVFIVILTACTKTDISFGNQFLDDGYTQMVQVDSFNVDLSTILVDSFVTSGKEVTLVGSYTDTVFGRVSAQTYLEVAPPSYVNALYADSLANALFDSIVLVLKTNGTYYGDSSRKLSVHIHRLSEPVTATDNASGYLFNPRSFAVQPAEIGSASVMVRPRSGDSVQIRLNDALGLSLLKKMQDPADIDMQSVDAFLQYFNGIRISADAGSQLVAGCTDSVIMRLCYRKPGLYMQSRRIDFTLANRSHHFLHIETDRSGTILKDLQTAQPLKSSSTRNAAYSSFASGAMIKIRFPSVRDVLKLPNYAKLLKATLVVRPVAGSYGGIYQLPPQLRLSQTTQLNQLGSDITSRSSDRSVASQTGSLYIDDLYGSGTAYTYDVTEYLRSIISNSAINNNGLLLIPPSPALETQFNRVVVGDAKHQLSKTQLILLYAAVQ